MARGAAGDGMYTSWMARKKASRNSKRRLARKPRGRLVCWPSNDGALLEVHVIRPLALMSLLGLALSAGADEATPAKPPLTKEQERNLIDHRWRQRD